MQQLLAYNTSVRNGPCILIVQTGNEKIHGVEWWWITRMGITSSLAGIKVWLYFKTIRIVVGVKEIWYQKL